MPFCSWLFSLWRHQLGRPRIPNKIAVLVKGRFRAAALQWVFGTSRSHVEKRAALRGVLRFHDISLLLRLQCCHKKISWWVYARPGVMAYCLQKPVSPSIVFPLTQWRKSIGSFCCECGSHNPSWWQVSITTLKYELVNTEKSHLQQITFMPAL